MLFCRFRPEIYPNVRFASTPSLFFIIPGFPDTMLNCWVALLNNQPLGFYPTDVLINDAKRRSIQILPVDVNRSEARCTVESKGAVRLSLTCVKGLSLSKAQRVKAACRTGKSVSIKDFARRTQLDCSVIEQLVAAGACDGFNLPRREMLLQVWILDRWREHNLFIEPELAFQDLPELNAWEELDWEYAAQNCSPRTHPMELLRGRLKSYVRRSDALKSLRDGGRGRACVAICIQRPPTAKGMAFLVLEGECGLMNVVIMPQVYERFRSIFRLSRFVYVRGSVQRRERTPVIRQTVPHPIETRHFVFSVVGGKTTYSWILTSHPRRCQN